MEFICTALTVAGNLNTALQFLELKDKLSIVFGYESELEDLQRTVGFIRAVLRDAETKQELSHELQHQIEELKDALFDADDLLDELVTLAHHQRVVDADGTLTEKVKHFFSGSNPICVSYWMSRGIKDIKKKLDVIAYNSQFSFKLDHEPIRNRRPETCSYVNEVEIIGRQHDLDHIVGMLLHSNVVQRNVSFLTIVGIGGLGKTALAQLVYNDPRIKSAFPLRLWTCVADQDQKELNVKEILGKILDPDLQGSTMERVQSQLRELLAGKKFFLVLDDVWTEKRDQWCELVNYLIGGERGSQIVVTTRSQRTATIVGGLMYELQSLSEENSWRLFKIAAFTLDHSLSHPDDLAKIGREIVDGCAGVPLAIKVVGSLLYGQDKGKWRSLQKIGLANMRKSENGIMPILKLSFHHLEAPLKSCFGYCALFPKDFELSKKTLISLWMAQGYIVPLDKGQSIEDAGEEYFSILQRRCFFQDIKKNNYGEVYSCKIHDLMHDVAQIVTEKEIYATNTIGGKLNEKVCHLSLVRSRHAKYSFHKSHIRSYLHVGIQYQIAEMGQTQVEALVANCMCLRALDLSWSRVKSLPDSVAKLLHLRYLDLSRSDGMEVLPRSITKLYNLQTLILVECFALKELPKDLMRLVNLRELDVSGCYKLTGMPKGMGKLTCLRRLSSFIVGGEGSDSNSKQWFDAMEDLKALNNLKGALTIKIRWPQNVKNVFNNENGKGGGLYLRRKEHLSGISLLFDDSDSGRVDKLEARRLMDELQPHCNLKELRVAEYNDVRMPNWVNLLPNLVYLTIMYCEELEYLPCLGNLNHLKLLKLEKLIKLEYIGVDSSSTDSHSKPTPCLVSAVGSSYYPSLKTISLYDLPKFKGWRRRVGDDRIYNLKALKILDCPELTCIPRCPKVEEVDLKKFNKRLQILETIERDEKVGVVAPKSASCNYIGNPSMSWSSFPENSSSSSSISIPNLEVTIDNVEWLNLQPIEAFKCLKILEIWHDKKVENLKEVGLLSVSGRKHLFALEELILHSCDNLRLSDEEQEDREDGTGIGLMPFPSLHHTLRTLKLSSLPHLVNLPNWMQFLTALQILQIQDCTALESMPKWMPKLTSLKKLGVFECSEQLKRRCQKDPPGEDWPYIQHISDIVFEYCGSQPPPLLVSFH